MPCLPVEERAMPWMDEPQECPICKRPVEEGDSWMEFYGLCRECYEADTLDEDE